jgi:hypothetical protein
MIAMRAGVSRSSVNGSAIPLCADGVFSFCAACPRAGKVWAEVPVKKSCEQRVKAKGDADD